MTDQADASGHAARGGSLGPPRLPEWVAPVTRLLHGARWPDLNAGAVTGPIYQTSTFHYPEAFSESRQTGEVHHYTRYTNPTLSVPARMVADLEEAREGRVFASGMGAITTTLLSFLRSGDEVVALDHLYGGTMNLLRTLAPRVGIRVHWVSEVEAAAPERVLTPAAKMAIIESPSNPLLGVTDISRWAEAADRAGTLLLVDNTFATPINQRPLSLGADLVVHSGTKYLGGHSDLMAGVVCGPSALMGRIDATHRMVGSVLDPFAAFLLARGLKTLDLRVRRQNDTGARVAEAMGDHRNVERVYYPGHGGLEAEDTCRRQMSGRGGVVSLAVRGGLEAARRALGRLRLVHVAASLGGVESLVSLPRESSHASLSLAELRALGIPDGLLRFSFGLEAPEDLIRDLSEALDYA